jgi:hypothetical protein
LVALGGIGSPKKTEEERMYARAVRFTDVSAERIEEIKARVQQAGGPPEGVDSTGMKLLFDASQGTALFIGFFDSEEKMRAADPVLREMDTGDTPGTRASIDQCEVALEMDA